MNENRQAKAKIVKEITSKIKNSKSFVVVNYSTLTVNEMQELRKEMKNHSVEAKVYKNRIFKIAANDLGFEEVGDHLNGQNLFVFGIEDDISPAKVISKFSKSIDNRDVLSFKVGTYEGKVVSSEELANIAKLPSMEEALTILAMSIQAPMKQMAVGLNMLVKEEKLEN